MMSLMDIDDRVTENAGTIDDLEGKVKENDDAIGKNTADSGDLDTRLMGLDAKAMENMMVLADLQGKSNANTAGVSMNSDEVKRL